MTPLTVIRGDGPVILGQPHGGTFIPSDIAARFNDNGRILADTDWHIAELYDGLLPGVSIVQANFHRYVIDATRDPAGQSLYPGQNTTGLCPVTDFDGRAIWAEGSEPTEDDIRQSTVRFHAPYHAALSSGVSVVAMEFFNSANAASFFKRIGGGVVGWDVIARARIPRSASAHLPRTYCSSARPALIGPHGETPGGAVAQIAHERQSGFWFVAMSSAQPVPT